MLVAEFRESIRPAIPQMITLLKIRDSGVRTVVANALKKLSEQGRLSNFLTWTSLMYLVAEFRKSIKSAIPQMITLLKIEDSDVRKVVANALAKLSEQGKVSNYLTWMLLMYLQPNFECQLGFPFRKWSPSLKSGIRVFVRWLQMHWQSSQSKVRYQTFWLEHCWCTCSRVSKVN